MPGFSYAAPGLLLQNEAYLDATNLILEQTTDQIILTLEGPVEIGYLGDQLNAESAVVVLRADADSLEEALISAELTGGVTYHGGDGTSGTASSASFSAESQTISLNGSANFSRGEMSATASRAVYNQAAKTVSLSGGCRLSDGEITASADSAEYNLISRSGSLSGSVEVSYPADVRLFGDERIDHVVMRAPTLFLSVDSGEVRTGTRSNSDRTSITAGNYELTADTVLFSVREDRLTTVTAEGRVQIEGPELELEADNISLSTTDRILRASGSITFKVRGQEGSAETMEVNFASGWSIQMSGATISGTLDEDLADMAEDGE